MSSPEPAQPSPLYANVVVPRHIARIFTYIVPAHLTSHVTAGQGVIVPFGRTQLQGLIISLTDRAPAGMPQTSLKPIAAVIPPSGPEDDTQLLFTLSRYIADEYLAPWGQCVRLILPSRGPAVRPALRLVITEHGRTALTAETCPAAWRPLLTRIARQSAGILASTIQAATNTSTREILRHLTESLWVETQQHEPRTRPKTARTAPTPTTDESCTTPLIAEAEADVQSRISRHLQSAGSTRLLVHGPTEFRLGLLIYVIREQIQIGRSVLILTGELARASWLAQRLRRTLGRPVTLAQRHDGPSPSQTGHTPQILVGTRSAVFSPLPALGLLWIEGEDDPALKEPKEPRYHARDVAWHRAQLQRVPLVLASAHPSLETRTDVDQTHWMLPTTPPPSPMIELADAQPGMPIGPRLLEALQQVVPYGGRAILFFNRKGFARALVCKECGWVPRCPSCQVALPYFREQSRLTCRYCGVSTAPPDTCATCGSARLQPLGEGTERLELDLHRYVPGARIMRIDGSLLRGKAGQARWHDVCAGQWDVLIGTQVLFEREPLPPVPLVGIIQADSGLHVPDFRAAERTYRLLTDAVGLALPAPAGGQVIIQTALPSHPAMQAVASQDPERFYAEELKTRQWLGYPPAIHLMLLTVSGKDRELTGQIARRWEALLQTPATSPSTRRQPVSASLVPGSGELTILGPVLAVGQRARGQARWHIMVKGQDRATIRALVRDSLTNVEKIGLPRSVQCSVDVDPEEMG